MIVVLVCDGYDKIPKDMKEYMTKKKLFNELLLGNISTCNDYSKS